MTSTAIRVGVLGAQGKVGSAICAAITEAPDLELSAKLGRGGSLDACVESGTQVVVDFTHPDSVMGNLKASIERGMHAVVGTTGFDADRLDEVRGWLADRPELGVPSYALVLVSV